MKPSSHLNRERGIALVVSLLFLLVVTIISVTAARNSTISLKMASNLQDQNNSLQSAEAGLLGALALASFDPNDPTPANPDPFVLAARAAGARVDPFPTGVNTLATLNEPTAVTGAVSLVAYERACPRPPSGSGGSSTSTVSCDYYRIDTEHSVASRARTKASLGVVKPILGSANQ